GPAPCVVSKNRGLFLWNLLVKMDSVEASRPALERAIARAGRMRTRITLDVDPR
ncbi:MAG: hypothetical protein HQL11_06880, partial [Candidatus Omnitrophica bacterium]|nr:hypothetical protein [Candidatus Omnitrophota bacterium]